MCEIDPIISSDVRFRYCVEHNAARAASMMAGIPVTVPVVTINRVCISGMEALSRLRR